MTIDLRDPTPLTPTEALIMVLDAGHYVGEDEQIPLISLSRSLAEFAVAEYKIRREKLTEVPGMKGTLCR